MFHESSSAGSQHTSSPTTIPRFLSLTTIIPSRRARRPFIFSMLSGPQLRQQFSALLPHTTKITCTTHRRRRRSRRKKRRLRDDFNSEGFALFLTQLGSPFFLLAPTEKFRKGPPFPRWERGARRPTLDMSNNFSSILTHANRVLLLLRLVLVVVSRFSLFRLLRGQSPQGLSLTHSRNNFIFLLGLIRHRFRTLLRWEKGPASFCFPFCFSLHLLKNFPAVVISWAA